MDSSITLSLFQIENKADAAYYQYYVQSQYLESILENQLYESNAEKFGYEFDLKEYRELLDDPCFKAGKEKSGIKSSLKGQYAEAYKANLDVNPKEAEELWSKVEKVLSAAGYDKDEIAHTKQEWKEGRTLTTYTYVYDAIEGNGDIAKAVKDVMAQGNKKGNVATSITNKYKPKMQELYKTDMKSANELKQKLLKAYQAAGYSFKDANKKINEWIK